jgi:hypothetical protein
MNHKTERLLPEKTHDQMIFEWMADPAFKAEYDGLENEYQELNGIDLWRVVSKH